MVAVNFNHAHGSGHSEMAARIVATIARMVAAIARLVVAMARMVAAVVYKPCQELSRRGGCHFAEGSSKFHRIPTECRPPSGVSVFFVKRVTGAQVREHLRVACGGLSY